MRFAVLNAVLLLLVSGNAHAQEDSGSSRGTSALRQPGGLFDTSSTERGPTLSFFGILPWWYGFGAGAGARYTLPIVKDGFISNLNDSVELEFGGDFWFANYGALGADYGYTGLAIPAEGRWTFHITPKFSAYGKVALGYAFHFWSDDVGDDFDTGHVYWDATSGVLYQLSDSMWLRGEVGYAGLKAGIGLKF
ncbi:porin family protein [Myxococcus sp. RHSTA-1-4]|uniref:porin family protein n=1 Tax=Myxococcus sp. RHSTA-1-4 TaxID=2874601 RepID=UPI001CBC57D9|nr:porin family protein [Myxococcus sp. RHSTA-1-4]MBZ4414956.1 porin family protein [Myxococcus sp. RHSTA-1-4]